MAYDKLDEIAISDSDEGESSELCIYVDMNKTFQPIQNVINDYLGKNHDEDDKPPYSLLIDLSNAIKKCTEENHLMVVGKHIWQNVVQFLLTITTNCIENPNFKYDEKFVLLKANIFADYVYFKCESLKALIEKNKQSEINIEDEINSILQYLYTIFHNNIDFILLVLIKFKVDRTYNELLFPIFSKICHHRVKNKYQYNILSYVIGIIVFKSWKKMAFFAKDKKLINDYLKQALPSYLPPVDKHLKKFRTVLPVITKHKENNATSFFVNDNKLLDPEVAANKLFGVYQEYLEKGMLTEIGVFNINENYRLGAIKTTRNRFIKKKSKSKSDSYLNADELYVSLSDCDSSNEDVLIDNSNIIKNNCDNSYMSTNIKSPFRLNNFYNISLPNNNIDDNYNDGDDEEDDDNIRIVKDVNSNEDFLSKLNSLINHDNDAPLSIENKKIDDSCIKSNVTNKLHNDKQKYSKEISNTYSSLNSRNKIEIIDLSSDEDIENINHGSNSKLVNNKFSIKHSLNNKKKIYSQLPSTSGILNALNSSVGIASDLELVKRSTHSFKKTDKYCVTRCEATSTTSSDVHEQNNDTQTISTTNDQFNLEVDSSTRVISQVEGREVGILLSCRVDDNITTSSPEENLLQKNTDKEIINVKEVTTETINKITNVKDNLTENIKNNERVMELLDTKNEDINNSFCSRLTSTPKIVEKKPREDLKAVHVENRFDINDLSKIKNLDKSNISEKENQQLNIAKNLKEIGENNSQKGNEILIVENIPKLSDSNVHNEKISKISNIEHLVQSNESLQNSSANVLPIKPTNAEPSKMNDTNPTKIIENKNHSEKINDHQKSFNIYDDLSLSDISSDEISLDILIDNDDDIEDIIVAEAIFEKEPYNNSSTCQNLNNKERESSPVNCNDISEKIETSNSITTSILKQNTTDLCAKECNIEVPDLTNIKDLINKSACDDQNQDVLFNSVIINVSDEDTSDILNNSKQLSDEDTSDILNNSKQLSDICDVIQDVNIDSELSHTYDEKCHKSKEIFEDSISKKFANYKIEIYKLSNQSKLSIVCDNNLDLSLNSDFNDKETISTISDISKNVQEIDSVDKGYSLNVLKECNINNKGILNNNENIIKENTKILDINSATVDDKVSNDNHLKINEPKILKDTNMDNVEVLKDSVNNNESKKETNLLIKKKINGKLNNINNQHKRSNKMKIINKRKNGITKNIKLPLSSSNTNSEDVLEKVNQKYINKKENNKVSIKDDILQKDILLKSLIIEKESTLAESVVPEKVINNNIIKISNTVEEEYEDEPSPVYEKIIPLAKTVDININEKILEVPKSNVPNVEKILVEKFKVNNDKTNKLPKSSVNKLKPFEDDDDAPLATIIKKQKKNRHIKPNKKSKKIIKIKKQQIEESPQTPDEFLKYIGLERIIPLKNNKLYPSGNRNVNKITDQILENINGIKSKKINCDQNGEINLNPKPIEEDCKFNDLKILVEAAVFKPNEFINCNGLSSNRKNKISIKKPMKSKLSSNKKKYIKKFSYEKESISSRSTRHNFDKEEIEKNLMVADEITKGYKLKVCGKKNNTADKEITIKNNVNSSTNLNLHGTIWQQDNTRDILRNFHKMKSCLKHEDNLSVKNDKDIEKNIIENNVQSNYKTIFSLDNHLYDLFKHNALIDKEASLHKINGNVRPPLTKDEKISLDKLIAESMNTIKIPIGNDCVKKQILNLVENKRSGRKKSIPVKRSLAETVNVLKNRAANIDMIKVITENIRSITPVNYAIIPINKNGVILNAPIKEVVTKDSKLNEIKISEVVLVNNIGNTCTLETIKLNQQRIDEKSIIKELNLNNDIESPKIITENISCVLADNLIRADELKTIELDNSHKIISIEKPDETIIDLTEDEDNISLEKKGNDIYEINKDNVSLKSMTKDDVTSQEPFSEKGDELKNIETVKIEETKIITTEDDMKIKDKKPEKNYEIYEEVNIELVKETENNKQVSLEINESKLHEQFIDELFLETTSEIISQVQDKIIVSETIVNDPMLVATKNDNIILESVEFISQNKNETTTIQNISNQPDMLEKVSTNIINIIENNENNVLESSDKLISIEENTHKLGYNSPKSDCDLSPLLLLNDIEVNENIIDVEIVENEENNMLTEKLIIDNILSAVEKESLQKSAFENDEYVNKEIDNLTDVLEEVVSTEEIEIIEEDNDDDTFINICTPIKHPENILQSLKENEKANEDVENQDLDSQPIDLLSAKCCQNNTTNLNEVAFLANISDTKCESSAKNMTITNPTQSSITDTIVKTLHTNIRNGNILTNKHQKILNLPTDNLQKVVKESQINNNKILETTKKIDETYLLETQLHISDRLTTRFVKTPDSDKVSIDDNKNHNKDIAKCNKMDKEIVVFHFNGLKPELKIKPDNIMDDIISEKLTTHKENNRYTINRGDITLKNQVCPKVKPINVVEDIQIFSTIEHEISSKINPINVINNIVNLDNTQQKNDQCFEIIEQPFYELYEECVSDNTTIEKDTVTVIEEIPMKECYVKLKRLDINQIPLYNACDNLTTAVNNDLKTRNNPTSEPEIENIYSITTPLYEDITPVESDNENTNVRTEQLGKRKHEKLSSGGNGRLGNIELPDNSNDSVSHIKKRKCVKSENKNDEHDNESNLIKNDNWNYECEIIKKFELLLPPSCPKRIRKLIQNLLKCSKSPPKQEALIIMNQITYCFMSRCLLMYSKNSNVNREALECFLHDMQHLKKNSLQCIHIEDLKKRYKDFKKKNSDFNTSDYCINFEIFLKKWEKIQKKVFYKLITNKSNSTESLNNVRTNETEINEMVEMDKVTSQTIENIVGMKKSPNLVEIESSNHNVTADQPPTNASIKNCSPILVNNKNSMKVTAHVLNKYDSNITINNKSKSIIPESQVIVSKSIKLPSTEHNKNVHIPNSQNVSNKVSDATQKKPIEQNDDVTDSNNKDIDIETINKTKSLINDISFPNRNQNSNRFDETYSYNSTTTSFDIANEVIPANETPSNEIGWNADEDYLLDIVQPNWFNPSESNVMSNLTDSFRQEYTKHIQCQKKLQLNCMISGRTIEDTLEALSPLIEHDILVTDQSTINKNAKAPAQGNVKGVNMNEILKNPFKRSQLNSFDDLNYIQINATNAYNFLNNAINEKIELFDDKSLEEVINDTGGNSSKLNETIQELVDAQHNNHNITINTSTSISPINEIDLTEFDPLITKSSDNSENTTKTVNPAIENSKTYYINDSLPIPNCNSHPLASTTVNPVIENSKISFLNDSLPISNCNLLPVAFKTVNPVIENSFLNGSLSISNCNSIPEASTTVIPVIENSKSSCFNDSLSISNCNSLPVASKTVNSVLENSKSSFLNDSLTISNCNSLTVASNNTDDEFTKNKNSEIISQNIEIVDTSSKLTKCDNLITTELINNIPPVNKIEAVNKIESVNSISPVNQILPTNQISLSNQKLINAVTSKSFMKDTKLKNIKTIYKQFPFPARVNSKPYPLSQHTPTKSRTIKSITNNKNVSPNILIKSTVTETDKCMKPLNPKIKILTNELQTIVKMPTIENTSHNQKVSNSNAKKISLDMPELELDTDENPPLKNYIINVEPLFSATSLISPLSLEPSMEKHKENAITEKCVAIDTKLISKNDLVVAKSVENKKVVSPKLPELTSIITISGHIVKKSEFIKDTADANLNKMQLESDAQKINVKPFDNENDRHACINEVSKKYGNTELNKCKNNFDNKCKLNTNSDSNNVVNKNVGFLDNHNSINSNNNSNSISNKKVNLVNISEKQNSIKDNKINVNNKRLNDVTWLKEKPMATEKRVKNNNDDLFEQVKNLEINSLPLPFIPQKSIFTLTNNKEFQKEKRIFVSLTKISDNNSSSMKNIDNKIIKNSNNIVSISLEKTSNNSSVNNIIESIKINNKCNKSSSININFSKNKGKGIIKHKVKSHSMSIDTTINKTVSVVTNELETTQSSSSSSTISSKSVYILNKLYMNNKLLNSTNWESQNNEIPNNANTQQEITNSQSVDNLTDDQLNENNYDTVIDNDSNTIIIIDSPEKINAIEKSKSNYEKNYSPYIVLNYDNDNGHDHDNDDHDKDHDNDHSNDYSNDHSNDYSNDHDNDHSNDHDNDHSNDHDNDHEYDHDNNNKNDNNHDNDIIQSSNMRRSYSSSTSLKHLTTQPQHKQYNHQKQQKHQHQHQYLYQKQIQQHQEHHSTSTVNNKISLSKSVPSTFSTKAKKYHYHKPQHHIYTQILDYTQLAKGINNKSDYNCGDIKRAAQSPQPKQWSPQNISTYDIIEDLQKKKTLYKNN